MAGQPQQGSRGRGRSPRRASSAALGARPSGADRGPAPTASPRIPSRTRARTAPPSEAEGLITRSTHRLLMTKGFTATEAADLTAFLCGIPVADVHWSLRQVNHLLFLRELARTGRFGPRDGAPVRPH